MAGSFAARIAPLTERQNIPKTTTLINTREANMKVVTDCTLNAKRQTYSGFASLNAFHLRS
jgi:proline dehydrogenase